MSKRIEIGDFRRTVPSEVLAWLYEAGVDLDNWDGYSQEKFVNATKGVLQYVNIGLIDRNYLGEGVLNEWIESLAT